ncbi:sodium channel protein Nach [Lucilia cuprina]|uniref:sodium channel protein Nach n=1 Tax=Lucilia cuprina TaxID=7375 RepID=UPI001F057D79|nr:sodium channel protein Nach [Lucilia cuprina]
MNCKEKLKQIPKMIFYVIFVGVSVPYYIQLSKGLYNNFFATNITFNLDTLYLNWNTSFPAVTICELYNGEKVWDLSEQYFGTEHDMRLDDVVGEIVYFHGICTSCDICENQNLSCPQNFTQLLKQFRTNCTDLIINCKYQNIFFDCCDEFYPLHTEYGVCFAFNSNQARKKYDVEYASNRIVGVGYLTFEVTTDVQLYVHSPVEIPFQSADGMIKETILLGSNKELVINAMEVYNHPNLNKINYEERRCRFLHELTVLGKELKLYEFYSFSTCTVECVFAKHLRLCNCSNHFLVKEDSPYQMCDYEGLLCLTDYFYDISEERRLCDCMSPCDEPEYNIIYNSADNIKKNSDITKIKISLAELPTTRYVRRVNKTNLDLMISIGGLAGLFFNASLIRIVELIFLILDYKWKSWKKC